MSSQKSLRETLDLVLTRKYLVAGIALSVFLAAVVVSLVLPKKYESFTKVRVVDNTALAKIYGRDMGGGGKATERIRAINEEILSRNTVSGLIHELNLDKDIHGLPEGERAEKREQLVQGILGNTRVDLLETARGEFIFKITHSNPDPALAQRIVLHLSTGYRNRQYADQKEGAADVLKSIQQEMRAARKDDSDVADRISSFEEKYTEYRFGEPNSIPQKLAAVKIDLQTEKIDLDTVSRQLADIQAQLTEEPEWVEINEQVGNELEIGRIKSELRAAKKILAELLQKWTDEHPQVKAQREVVRSLETDLARAIKEVRTIPKKVRNPAYDQLKESERDCQAAIQVHQAKYQFFERQVNELDALAKAYPELKKRWDGLVDDRSSAKSKLSQLEERERRADTNWQAKMAESAIIFSVLDPPVYPIKPVSPNRMLISLVGLLLGLGVGVGSVFVVDFFDHSFRYTEEVAAALEVPVLGSIARIESLEERESATRKRRLAMAGVAVLLLLGVAAVFLLVVYDGEIGPLVRSVTGLVK